MTLIASHWLLTADPFRPGSGPFVSTPGHTEAVARLQYAVEAGEKLGYLEAEAGLGKSVVLGEVLRRVRHPSRWIARCSAPLDGAELYATLARGLGVRRPAGLSRGLAWAALSDAVRLAARQRMAVVLVVDDVHALGTPDDLRRLGALAERSSSPLTVLGVGRPGGPDEPGGWELTIRLPPLSRDEADAYLHTKLEAAGRRKTVFTPGAVTRLHALSGGIPRGLDRLAGLALAAGALHGVEIITPELVEAVAPECRSQGELGAPAPCFLLHPSHQETGG